MQFLLIGNECLPSMLGRVLSQLCVTVVHNDMHTHV